MLARPCSRSWRAVVDQTRGLPPTLAAAIAADAWAAIEPLEHKPWLGRLLAAALLRDRGKTSWHLSSLHVGLKSIPHQRRRPRDVAARVAVQLEAMTAAAEAGRKDHDRWLMKRNLLARKLAGHRATSKLPALLDFVLTRPIVSAGMIAAELKRPVPLKISSSSSACARRPGGDAIGRGASCRAPGQCGAPRLFW